jgi:Effector Associated Constant Component 1
MESSVPGASTVKIQFDGLNDAAANQAALSLRTFLLDQGEPGVEIKIEKSSSSNQDFGSTLVLLLGTRAAIEIAKGIATWLRRRADATGLVIVNAGGNRVEIKGPAAASANVAQIAKALGYHHDPQADGA